MRKWRWILGVVAMLLANVGSVWGQFGSPQIISRCDLPCSTFGATAADFDRDGDLDLIFDSWDNNQISWYRNDGIANFKEQNIGTLAEYGKIILVNADIDQDGDQDIIAPVHDGKIFWFVNDGRGQFSKRLIFNTRGPISYIDPAPFRRLFVKDVDADGYLDVVVYFDSSDEIIWYKNDGKYNFTQVDRIYEYGLVLLEAQDLDSDGDVDLMASNYRDKTLFWFEYNNGELIKRPIVIPGTNNLDAITTIADVDGDEKLDVLFPSNQLKLFYCKGNGKGTFSEPKVLINNWVFAPVFSWADMDLDGDQDMVCTDFYDDDHKIILYKNEGSGRFSPPISLYKTVDYLNEFFYCGDMDNDKDIDIITFFDDVVCLYDKGGQKFEKYALNNSPIRDLKDVVYFDVDTNGYQDIIASSNGYYDGQLWWYANTGKGSFLSPVQIDHDSAKYERVFVIEIDHDKEHDLITFNKDNIQGFHSINYLKNTGKGVFEKKNLINTKKENLSIVEVGDLDNDGNTDILAVQAAEKEAYFYKNDGDGNFLDAQLLFSTRREIKFVEVIDLDTDGDNDIVISMLNYGIVNYVNDGQGNFLEGKVIYYSPTGLPFKLDDLDQDGDLDLVVDNSDYSWERINWLENLGNFEFSHSKPLFYSDQSSLYPGVNFNLGDIDGDLDKDIIFNSWYNDQLFWIENKGGGQFTSERLISKDFFNGYSICLVDIDNDRDLDIFTNSNDNRIVWYENLFNYPNISGVAFWDKNTNGKFDPEETIIKNLPIQLTPSATSTFTGSDGKYRFYVPDGKYQISVQPDECWQLTTDSLSYTVNIAGNVALNRNFGFQLVPKAQAVQPRLSSGPTRCGFDVPFVLSVHNEGCVPSKGMFGLVRSPLAKYLGAAVFPDRVRGDTLLWNYASLVGTATQQLKLSFQIEGTDFLGDTIHIKTLAYIENPQGQLQLASTYDYRSEIRCAYDPNDKLTFPNRRNAYPRNYTLFKEEMEFLVRFQNTGNDTAFTVVIHDTLDKNLDWSTFRPLAGSHPFETHIQENGAVSFTFKNILLPDSKTNEPLSHGFVSYRISPKRGLPEQTEILNTAYIYFDFNPPIQTNTTSNVMVSSLPRVTRTKDINSSLDHKLYPNPFDDQLLLEIATVKTGGNYTFTLLNSQSQTVQHKKVTSAIERIDTQEFPSGLYFYLIKNTQGRVVASGKVVCR